MPANLLFLLWWLPSYYPIKPVRFHDLRKAICQGYLLIHNSFLVVLRSTTRFKRKAIFHQSTWGTNTCLKWTNEVHGGRSVFIIDLFKESSDRHWTIPTFRNHKNPWHESSGWFAARKSMLTILRKVSVSFECKTLVHNVK